MTATAPIRILILASDGFEQDELFVPLERLRAARCEVVIAAPEAGSIRATVLDAPGKSVAVDCRLDDVDAAAFDALLLPGGLINPDRLRTDVRAVDLVNAFIAAGKPIGAICHGPWLLIEADALRGRRATGWKSIRTDLRNAGALVEEGPVVVDGSIVTAVGPADSANFSDALLTLVQVARQS